MKTKFFVVALMVAVVGFGACGGGKDKSDDNNITGFVVGTTTYQVGASVITGTYSKTGENNWPDLPTGSATPTITLSHSKAKHDSPTLNFGSLGVDGGNVGTVTVTAENGDKKTYTVTVVKGVLP